MTATLRLPDVVAPAPATAGVPGIGGRIRARPEDFVVEEIPAYEADGAPDGAHVLFWIEKRGRTTDDAVREIARVCGIPVGAVGVAGKKDRHAVTRQQLSVPREAAAALARLDAPDLGVVSTPRPHRNKLRIGHLRGNRFTVTVRDVHLPADEVERRLERKRDDLRDRGGLENRYGAQRFGKDASNAAKGLARLREGRLRKGDIVVSAGQSVLFNHYLLGRRLDGTLRRAESGDIVQKTDTGGMFVCEDPGEVTPRLERGDAVLTGPMFGSRMRAPPAGTPAAEREARTLAWGSIPPERIAGLGRAVPGTRRRLLVAPGELAWSVGTEQDRSVVRITFVLPAGSYATVLLDELMHPPPDPP
ncbi:MAG: tRNA pseudouridine(13) synthase TruD [Deltaproteobacteria bacterium]|nr:MAG: tRNA pseudouridine(13) synthase TruD [Deltaproteobacteria bacterium]